MSEIRVIDVNSRTLPLFGADDKKTLLHRLPRFSATKWGRPFASS